MSPASRLRTPPRAVVSAFWCRIPSFAELSRTITRHRPAIDAALEHGLSNALIESANTKIRLITRVGFEFKGAGRARSGKPFSAEHLRDVALRPAYGGYRTHVPGSKAGGAYRGPLPAEPNAGWPALVDQETFWLVRTMLLSPDRRTSRPGRGVHLLSMIARCECGGAMTVLYRRGERMYRCRDRSCAMVLADDLDEYAQAVMLAYLARDDVIGQLRSGETEDAELTGVRVRLEAARAELKALRTAGRLKKLTVATILELEPALAADVDRLEQRERELSAPPALAGMLEPGKDVARRWADAPMPARRHAARLLCSPALLGALTVHRNPETGRGHRVSAAERVTWDRQA